MRRIVTLVLVFIATATFVRSASADLILQLDDGTNSIIVYDNLAGDLNPLSGIILFSGDIGDWDVSITTGLGLPVLGTPTEPEIDLDSVNISGGGTGELTIQLTQTDNVGTGFPSLASYRLFGNTPGTLSAEAFYDTSNTEFGQSTSLTGGVLGPYVGTTFTTQGSQSYALTGLYSLTLWTQVQHSGSGFTDYQFNLKDPPQPVPEPSTQLLLSMGLIAVVGVRYRRRRK